jgi:hypothetical protein
MRKENKEGFELNQPIEPSMTEAQAAAALGLSPSKVQMMRRTGDGPVFYTVGIHVRYRPERLREWMQAREVATMAEACARDKKSARRAERKASALSNVRNLRWPKSEKEEAAEA